MEEPGPVAAEEKRTRRTGKHGSYPTIPLEVWGRIGGRQREARFLGVGLPVPIVPLEGPELLV